MKYEVAPLWTRWLFAVSIAGFCAGLLLAFTPLFTDLIGPTYYNTFFGGEDVYATLSEGDLQFQTFLYGIAGALMASWMLSLGFITQHGFRRGERWAWNAIELGTLVWFLGDGYASIVSGFAAHAALNLSLLLLIAVPLAATYRQFHRERRKIPV